MQLYSRLEGKGPVLVLSHGWTMSHRFFERQRPLAEHFRLLFWDLPGHGDSEKRPEGYQLGDAASALRELLAQHGIREAVALGWSMGAQILWDYVERFGPEPFTHFVNVDALPWGDPKAYHVPGVTHSFHRDRPRAARKFVKRMFFHKPAAEELEAMVQDSLRTPTEIALKYYGQIAHCDYRRTFAALDRPLLSLMGRHGFHPEQVPELQALHPRQDFVWFERSGHMPFWEEAGPFNQLLLERFAKR
ncbi:MAG: alpha/beta hydrolase [bacterium]